MRQYHAIVADPPWVFAWQGGPGGRRRNRTELGYSAMELWELERLPVPQVAGSDCALFLWVTREAHRNGHGLYLAEAWGFDVVGELIWSKPNFGMGAFPRIGHETCLVCSQGRGLGEAPRDVHSVQVWAQDYSNNAGKKHSAKPEGFYDLVERSCPGPYLEMFARRARLGWDYYGDESLGTAEVAA